LRETVRCETGLLEKLASRRLGERLVAFGRTANSLPERISIGRAMEQQVLGSARANSHRIDQYLNGLSRHASHAAKVCRV
jgi:hypothetical protein